MKSIAIFASGTGTNAKRIIQYFSDRPKIDCKLVVSNKKSAPVIDMAKGFGVETMLINRTDFYQTELLLEKLQQRQIDWIILAGFLWLVPKYLITAFPNRIINIHPALLPKFGGKGMYGMHVHRAVKAAEEVESGITIHFVNEVYDEGAIIFQASCGILPGDKPEDIAKKVQKLEHQYFAPQIEALINREL